VIDYVIVHKLSHLKELNHSKNFWNEFKKCMPEYKKHHDWLKNSFKLKF
jgi:Predicted metal-dependent hydrolase